MAYSKERISTGLTHRQVTNLAFAADFAFYTSRPLNTFISIHCDKGRVGDCVQDFIGRYLKLVGDWIRPLAGPAHWLWVLEHPSGGGLNWHCLLYLPIALQTEFAEKHVPWLIRSGVRDEGEANVEDGVSDVKYRPPGKANWYSDAEHAAADLSNRKFERANWGHVENLIGILHYLFKGALPEVRLKYGFEDAPQGGVAGRRCSTSETIGVSARASFYAANPGYWGKGRRLRSLVLNQSGYTGVDIV